MDKDEVGRELTRRLIEQGALIEGGFAAFLSQVIKNASTETIAMLRIAYISGAEHMFSSMMTVMDVGEEEPTEADIHRMNKIHEEVERYRAQLQLLTTQSRGNA